MIERRRVCVVTGSRAEYGLLAPLMHLLERDAEFELQLIITGTHLSPAFGMTVNDIEADGFTAGIRVPLPLDDDTPVGTCQAMAAALAGVASALASLAPDIVVVLGDRYEMLAAAEAAFISGCVVAHIHGGEVTAGALDDGFRHAITKLSHLHFVSAEPYRERVIRMGENPAHVFNVSALALDVIAQTPLVSREELERAIGISLGERYFALTYQPVTLDHSAGTEELQELLAALDTLGDYHVLVTGHNADPWHSRIGALLDQYAAGRPGRVHLKASLGQKYYLSAMKHAAAVVGNSSSGIIEAPALGVPTVNIGRRQEGRLRSSSVVDCGGNASSIAACIRVALDATFAARARTATSPYGSAGAAARILSVLKAAELTSLAVKPFALAPAAMLDRLPINKVASQKPQPASGLEL